MAIRQFDNDNNIVARIVLKNGKNYEDCDIPPELGGNYERFISVWIDDRIRIFPMEEIEYFELYEKDN